MSKTAEAEETVARFRNIFARELQAHDITGIGTVNAKCPRCGHEYARSFPVKLKWSPSSEAA